MVNSESRVKSKNSPFWVVIDNYFRLLSWSDPVNSWAVFEDVVKLVPGGPAKWCVCCHLVYPLHGPGTV
jgi:hypothetical protein